MQQELTNMQSSEAEETS